MSTTTVEKAFCTTTEAATLLGVSVGTVQLWVESGMLDAWKTSGGHRRVLRDSIERLLLRRETPVRISTSDLLEPGDPGRLNVLVVEDDPNLLRLYEANISRWPLRPDLMVLGNAFTALIRMGRTKPDLLILDLQMPGIDGFSLLRVLGKEPETADIRVVVVSGMDAGAIADKGGIPPGVELLPKPIPFARLQAIANEVAQSPRVRNRVVTQ